jgi:hypothetical protein
MRAMNGRRAGVLAAALVIGGATPAWSYHVGDMIMGSTAASGGALEIRYDFSRKVRVSPSISLGGTTLHTGTDPGFDALDLPEPPLNVLATSTPVTLEIIALDPPVSLQVRTAILDASGATAPLGNMTADGDGLHVHPTWRLALPDGIAGEYHLSFRLTTTAAQYRPSETYTLIITNSPEDASTTTTTLQETGSTSTTLPPPPCSGVPPHSDDAIACRLGLLDDALAAIVSPDRRVRRVVVRLDRSANEVTRLLNLARGAADRRVRRLHARALIRLSALQALASRAARRGELPADVAQRLVELTKAARSELGTST